LIDKNGNALLADFGLLTIVSDSTYPSTSGSSINAGTIRWMSPELLDPGQFGSEDGQPTKESDCYALGMTILEVLSGRPPFHYYRYLTVMQKAIEGERPRRLEGPEGGWFTDDLWGMLELCWSHQSENRPTIEAVLECLEQGLTTWQPLPPSLDNAIQTDGNEGSHPIVTNFCMFSHFILNIILTISQPL